MVAAVHSQPLEDGNMSLIGYSPWQDAAAYGRGLGDSLSQGLLALPQQKFALAQQAAQMQQRNQMFQLQQQGLNNYRQGTLDWRDQGLAERSSQNNILDTIKAALAAGQQGNWNSEAQARQAQSQAPKSLGNGNIYDPKDAGADERIASRH